MISPRYSSSCDGVQYWHLSSILKPHWLCQTLPLTKGVKFCLTTSNLDKLNSATLWGWTGTVCSASEWSKQEHWSCKIFVKTSDCFIALEIFLPKYPLQAIALDKMHSELEMTWTVLDRAAILLPGLSVKEDNSPCKLKCIAGAEELRGEAGYWMSAGAVLPPS